MALWVKGQSGNPKGGKRKALIDGDLKSLLRRNGRSKSKALASVLLEKALAGNVQALKLVAERVAGKPKPAEPPAAATSEEKLTREQVRLRLAELLNTPEMKTTIVELLTEPKAKVQ